MPSLIALSPGPSPEMSQLIANYVVNSPSWEVKTRIIPFASAKTFAQIAPTTTRIKILLKDIVLEGFPRSKLF